MYRTGILVWINFDIALVFLLWIRLDIALDKVGLALVVWFIHRWVSHRYFGLDKVYYCADILV